MYFGFRDVQVRYGKKEILHGLTLEIPRGKVVTLIGQNGCGKSTLLKTVSKAVTPKAGAFRLPAQAAGAEDRLPCAGARISARH